MKSIAELIIERANAEGGTLVVFTDVAKFRVIDVVEGREYLRPRYMYVNADLGERDTNGIVYVPGTIQDRVSSRRFSPSPELMNVMRRNTDEVQLHLDRMVKEWRTEVGARIPIPPASGPSIKKAEPTRTRGSQQICDCHAVSRSSISEKRGESANFGGSSVGTVTSVGGNHAVFAAGSEITGTGSPVQSSDRSFGGKA